MRPIPTRLWLWPLLALPAVAMTAPLLAGTTPAGFRALLHPSGEFAARFLIVAMLATPLMLVLRGWRGPRWLMRQRRAFGVAAFGYAALHGLAYVAHRGDLGRIVGELDKTVIWTGWLALLIMLPLAATSNDCSLRRLGPRWKAVQRWTYPLALLTLWHWAAAHHWNGWLPATVHFAPLALLTLHRLWWNARRWQRAVAA
jgi:sulfoxide reductase heme-binding subunit YedZ